MRRMTTDLYRRAYLRANYGLRTFAGGRWATHCCPTSIAFVMTNLCNAKCVHCDIWKNRGREESPTPAEYRKVLSDLRRWLGPVPVFFTGGEALLQPHTIDLLRHASAVGLYAELLTHGYWDDLSRIERVALANPARVTVSLDGMGETHTRIRGRERFFERTAGFVETLRRQRSEKRLGFTIRLKTVVMEHNLGDLENIARYAADRACEVFYQPIEQNYNTPADSEWFEHSDNWPRDASRAVAAVRGLIDLKRSGLPVANSYRQLEAMIPYFEAPAAHHIAVQQHSAHENVPICNAMTNVEILPNGDVLTCPSMPAVGNIRARSIREIWRNRPVWWHGGCCRARLCADSEKAARGLVALGGPEKG